MIDNSSGLFLAALDEDASKIAGSIVLRGWLTEPNLLTQIPFCLKYQTALGDTSSSARYDGTLDKNISDLAAHARAPGYIPASLDVSKDIQISLVHGDVLRYRPCQADFFGFLRHHQQFYSIFANAKQIDGRPGLAGWITADADTRSRLRQASQKTYGRVELAI